MINGNYIKRTLNDSPLKQILCKKCNKPIHRIECDNINNLPNIITCQHCKIPNHYDSFIITDDWNFTVNNMEHFLEMLCRTRSIHEGYQIYCTKCIEIKPLKPLNVDNLQEFSKQELIKYLRSFYCNRCGNISAIQKVYSINETLFYVWTNGIWLEWYTHQLLINSKMKISYIKQGARIRKENKEEVEIDVLLISNNKIISIECTDIKIDKVAERNNVDKILKLIDISDFVVYVTTTEIESKVKKNLLLVSKESKKPVSFIFIQGNEIENLPKILLERIEHS